MKLELRNSQKYKTYQKQIEKNVILQMDVHKLMQYIENIAMENPLIDIDSLLFTENVGYSINSEGGIKPYDAGYNIENVSDNLQFEKESLKQVVHLQLVHNKFADTYLSRIAEDMVDLLDDDGYFRISKKDACVYLACDEIECEQARELLARLEPAGLAARNLGECLLQQLGSMDTDEDTDIAKRIVSEYLEELSKHHYSAIAKQLNVSQKRVRQASEIIQTLSPRPAMKYSTQTKDNYITPDLIVVKEEEKYIAKLNPSIYKDIVINSSYTDITKYSSKETAEYVEKKLRQVYWVRQCIEERKQLLLSIAEFLLEYQQDFFLNHGLCHPLLQKDLAQIFGVHESTISRAINNKYLQCDRGVFRLSDFIPKGYEMESVDAIKQMIKETITSEDKFKPFSDQRITDILNQNGVEISRRTVAKYRMELSIPDASGRKIEK